MCKGVIECPDIIQAVIFPSMKSLQTIEGMEICIQHSSSADEPATWIYCKRNGKDDTPHINVEDAKKVRDALNKFISAYE